MGAFVGLFIFVVLVIIGCFFTEWFKVDAEIRREEDENWW